jgi:hypothetical protein
MNMLIDNDQTNHESLAALLGDAARARAEEAMALAELRRSLLAAAEQNARLHRETVAALDSVRRELLRMQRLLKSIASAR